MKRLLALITVLACLLALGAPVMAAEDTITVRVKAPEEWVSVFLYMWDNMTDDKTPNASWPGQEMTEGDDGWYELEIPVEASYDSVIVSDGNAQTPDISVDRGCDLWITVDASGSYGVAYKEEDAGKIDFNGPASMAIVGSGIPGVADWDPADPAGDMEEVENNVYVKQIGFGAACTMTFKFAGNDGWDDTCNFGTAALTIGGEAVEMVCGGDSTNITLAVEEPCVLKFTVDLNPMAEGGAATVKVEEVEGAEIPEAPETPETPAEETVRIYAKVPADWADPCCWAWDNTTLTNAFTGWPGNAMTLDGEWYVIDIPTWCDAVIINGNAGAVQTADLLIVAGKDAYIDVSDPANVVVEQEGVETPDVEQPTEPGATEPQATEPAAADDASSAEEQTGLKTSTIIILVVCGLVVVACIVVAIVVLKPKKD